MTLADRISTVEARIRAACNKAGRSRDSVTLVAVTKTVSIEIATMAFELGLHDLAENRPQELWKKQAALPQARWHFIGHLQRNKLDKTVPLTALLHSGDSPRLLEALDAFGRKHTPVPVLLEINCSREPNKGGFAPEDLPALASSLSAMAGLELHGLMTMAAYSDDPATARPAFAELRTLRDDLAQRLQKPLPHLSMGMSNDFEIAIEEGATLIRLGSVLFEGLA